MEDKYLMAVKKLKKYGQEQLLNCYTKLDRVKQENLLRDILNTDFEEIQNLYKKIQKENENIEVKIEPIKYVDKEKISLEKQKHYMDIGKKIIQKGEYAVVTMAGGQRN